MRGTQTASPRMREISGPHGTVEELVLTAGLFPKPYHSVTWSVSNWPFYEGINNWWQVIEFG